MKKRTVKIIAGVFAVGFLLGGVALGAIMWHIHQSVGEYCAIAQRDHPRPGDNVAALLDFMNSGSHSFQERNLAVWTLGRLSDARALPTLQGAYTGEPCEHAKKLCQYELEKAIKRCGSIPIPPRKTKHSFA